MIALLSSERERERERERAVVTAESREGAVAGGWRWPAAGD